MSKECLISAIIAWDPSNYVSLENNIDILQSETELKYFCTPEQIFLRKESVLSLSDDSKNLLKFILDTPDDMINFIVGKRGEISKERLVVFLKVIGWTPSKINRTFKELKYFCRGY